MSELVGMTMKLCKLEIDYSILESELAEAREQLKQKTIRIAELGIKLDTASQEIASLQQCDCIERGAE